jgi:hypothetical protein
MDWNKKGRYPQLGGPPSDPHPLVFDRMIDFKGSQATIFRTGPGNLETHKSVESSVRIAELTRKQP